jgi:hypothetical protein
MATTPGGLAYAIPLGSDERRVAVFTHCFLRAFRAPDPDMILAMREDGEFIYVIPNRRLRGYLQREWQL